ncbi:MAG: thermonuclease family protein [Hyphomicrobiaceae bacterium]
MIQHRHFCQILQTLISGPLAGEAGWEWCTTRTLEDESRARFAELTRIAVRLTTVCTGLLAAILAIPASVAATVSASLPCSFEPGPERAVAAVLDGDTVRLDDGSLVRLVGALAPHQSDAGTGGTPQARAMSSGTHWPPADAARRALAALTLGKSVKLAFSGRRSDRNKMWLAQVFVVAPAGDVWVQGRMVDEGHARAYTLPGVGACLADLVKREAKARAGRKGLWAHAAYQVRQADRPTDLAGYANTFQIVEGQITHARRTRWLSIVSLADAEPRPQRTSRYRHRDLRLVWSRQVGGMVIENPSRLTGHTVMARGWITVRRGPEIQLISADDLWIEN